MQSHLPHFLLLGTLRILVAKLVGKVKGCLRWRLGLKKEKEKQTYASIKSIFNLFFSVLSCHGGPSLLENVLHGNGEQSSFLRRPFCMKWVFFI